MAKFKSPGQKRKRLVQMIMLIIFAASTYVGAIIVQKYQTAALAWTKDHTSIEALITNQYSEEEEYRNAKGRLRHRTVFYIDYEFTLEAETYTNNIAVDQWDYEALNQGETVTVWYASDEPYINDTKENLSDALAHNDIVSNSISAAPYTAPTCLFLYWLLSMIFVKESKKSLPEGFYTENSWLDIDDNYLVALDGSNLISFDIDSKRSAKVQTAYQEGASIEVLRELSKSNKFKTIPLADVTLVESNHNSDVIGLEVGEDCHSIEFLNQTVKAHALTRISPHLNTNLQCECIEKTRLGSALPAALLLLTLLAIAFFAAIFWLSCLIGLLCIIKVIPRILVRLFDPTVRQRWTSPSPVTKECTEG